MTIDDGAGGQTVTLTDVGSARGDVRQLSGRELIEAQQAGAEHTHSCYFRARADIARNDELRRGLAETAVLDLPGGIGDYVLTVNHASLNITGPLWLAIDAALDDWTPAALSALISKWLEVFPIRAYRLMVTAAGAPEASISSTGGDVLTATGGALGFVDGSRHGLGVEIVPNDGAGNRTFQFYVAPTLAGPWTPHGALITQAGAVSIFVSSTALNIGAMNNGSATLAGLVYGAEIRSGNRTGTLVARPDFTKQTPGVHAFIDGLGLPWVLEGTAAVVALAGAEPADRLLVLTVSPTFPGTPDGRLRVTARTIEGGG